MEKFIKLWTVWIKLWIRWGINSKMNAYNIYLLAFKKSLKTVDSFVDNVDK